MSAPTYDRDFWEGLWARTLRDHPDKVARKPPDDRLVALAGQIRPGRALDAGCGHGGEALWLAGHGWRVTAVDFSAAALEHARSTAEALGEHIAGRIDWLHADLTRWTPPAGHFDLVASLYVHVPGSVEAMVRRLADAVAPGGTLFMVGHPPVDPATGAPTRAAGQVQVSVEAARAALDPRRWSPRVAEHRPRTHGGGVDAVIHARRVG